ncbi:hypothetical protein AKUG0702_13350 [Apilactobacillus kunkeei]|nr:hypothetical protein AKUG0702_13350 [Apilactobacillus kunkeei]
MNKIFKIFLALFTCLLVLSACGKKKAEDTNQTILVQSLPYQTL